MSSKSYRCHHNDDDAPEFTGHSQYQQIACQLFGKRVQDFCPDSIDNYDDEDEETGPCRKKRKQDLSIIGKTYEAPKRETGPRGRCLVCYSIINQEDLTNAQNKQNHSALLHLIKLPSTEQGTSDRFSWLLAGSNFTLEETVSRLTEGPYNCLCLICNSICEEILSKRQTICKLEQEILELQKITLSVIKASSELAAAKQLQLITEERDQFVDNINDIKCHLKIVRMVRKCLIGDGNREDLDSANMMTDGVNNPVKSESDEDPLIDWAPSDSVDENEFVVDTCKDSHLSNTEPANRDPFCENDATSPVHKIFSNKKQLILSSENVKSTHEDNSDADGEDMLEPENEIKEDVDADTEWDYNDLSGTSDSKTESSEEENDKRTRVSGADKQNSKLRKRPVDKTDIYAARGSTRQDLKDHVQKVHEKNKPYTCDYCDKRLAKKAYWIKHKKVHKDKYPFVCKICSDRFTQLSSLKEHELENRCTSSKLRWNEKHKCDTCGVILASKQNFEDHVQTVHRKIKSFICNVCGKKFALSSGFKKHMRLHTRECPYECKVCSEEFSQLPAARRHQLTHDNESNYPCDQCSKSFIDEPTLKLHLDTVHFERQCEQCGKGFKNKSKFSLHMKMHEGKQPHACQICPEKFLSLCRLKLHMLRKHSEAVTFQVFECTVCTKTFSDKKSLRDHTVTHAPKNDDFKCEHCGKLFRTEKYLKVHKMMHTGTEKPFSCNICSESFRMNVQLKQHLVMHHNQSIDVNILECADCKKMFSTKSHLQSHRKSAHGSGEHVCEKCSCRYQTESALITHVKLHCGKKWKVPSYWKEENGMVYYRNMEVYSNAENMLVCPTVSCGKSFKTREKLSDHFRVAHDEDYKAREREKCHQCDQCEMRFSKKGSLLDHITAIHEGGFVCDICGTTRSSKRAIEVHKQRDHEGVRPFVCKHCGKSYFKQKDLTVHERHHTGEKPFACHLCSSTFINKNNLNIHIRTLHLGEKPRSKSKSNQSS